MHVILPRKGYHKRSQENCIWRLDSEYSAVWIWISESAKATSEPFEILSQQICKSYVRGIHVALTKVQHRSGQPQESRANSTLPGQAQTQLGRTREQDIHDWAISEYLACSFPPQFNYDHGLGRGLRNSQSLLSYAGVLQGLLSMMCPRLSQSSQLFPRLQSPTKKKHCCSKWPQ